MNNLTKERIQECHFKLTIGDIKNIIKKYNLSDDVIILTQRVEDRYFDGVEISGMMGVDGIYPQGSKASGWDTYPVKGFYYYKYLKLNKDIDSGKYLDKEQFPKINPEADLIKYTDEELEGSKDQYSVATCCWYDEKENKEFLFINLHY